MPLRPCLLLALLVASPAVVGAVPAAHAGQPTTSRVSLSSGGNEGTGAATAPSVSADGRYVVFSSSAPDLVAGDTNARTDIFLRDRTAGVTRRVNVGPGGVQDNGGFADAPVISADGRTVVLRSDATNLAPVGPGRHLFAYDRVSGAVRVIAPAPPMQARPFGLDVSADGRRVVYNAGVAGIDQVFTADTVSGAVQPVTQTPAGVAGNGGSFDPVISGDGRMAAFTTAATNLAPVNPNGFREVLARDLSTGLFSRLSLGAGDVTPNLHSSTPALSADGCRAAFFSSANNLVAADNGISPAIQPKVFVRDRCNADTEVASLSNAGALGVASVPIALSADGCSVAFLAASIVVPAPAGGSAAVLRDRCAGTTSRLDLSSAGEPGAGGVIDLALSATGRYAVFVTSSAGLVPGDSNNTFDVFLRDRGTNTPPVATATLTQTGRRVVVDAAASRDPDGRVAPAQTVTFSIARP